MITMIPILFTLFIQIIKKSKISSETFGFNSGPKWKDMDKSIYEKKRTGIRIAVAVEKQLDDLTEYEMFKNKADEYLSHKGLCDKSLHPISIRQKRRTSYINYWDPVKRDVMRKRFDFTKSKCVDGGSFSTVEAANRAFELEFEMGTPQTDLMTTLNKLVPDLFSFYGFMQNDRTSSAQWSKVSERMILNCNWFFVCEICTLLPRDDLT
jgi:hypothetical protein